MGHEVLCVESSRTFGETGTSAPGHSRRFGHTSAISGLPLTVDVRTNAPFRSVWPEQMHHASDASCRQIPIEPAAPPLPTNRDFVPWPDSAPQQTWSVGHCEENIEHQAGGAAKAAQRYRLR